MGENKTKKSEKLFHCLAQVNTKEWRIYLLVFPKTYTLKADPKTNCSKKPKLLPLSLHSGLVFMKVVWLLLCLSVYCCVSISTLK